MVRILVKVLLADLVLLLAVFEVLLDLQWRSTYAASIHSACPQGCGYMPSFSYSVLTQFFELTGNGRQLVSPATLDWVQALAVVIVILNAWYVIGYLRTRKNQMQQLDGVSSQTNQATIKP